MIPKETKREETFKPGCEDAAYEYLYIIQNLTQDQRNIGSILSLPPKSQEGVLGAILDKSEQFLLEDPEIEILSQGDRQSMAETIKQMRQETLNKERPVDTDTIQWLGAAYQDLINEHVFWNMLVSFERCQCPTK